jgi:hypothetical protein
MNEDLPNEEMDQRFNDLPLPDEEASWQKMNELLSKDEDDDRIVPPVFLSSCMGWGILLLAGLTVAWFVIRPEKWWNESVKSKPTSAFEKTKKQSEERNRNHENNRFSTPATNRSTTNNFNQKLIKTNPSQPIQLSYLNKNKDLSKRSLPNHYDNAKDPEKNSGTHSPTINDKENQKSKDKQANGRKDSLMKNDSISTATDRQQVVIIKDSLVDESTIQQKDSSVQMKSKQKQKKLIVSAGAGMQQLIPIAGQTMVPYSYYGRQGSLADYVPSVYIQVQKDRKWFVMGEFRFGAAQSVKEFLYNQHTRYDTASMNLTMTTMRLKKTYYHQLPLSFNYFIIPNLSIGIGGMYSRFYGAISEKETNTWNVLTQTNTSFKQIIPIKHFTDSFLYKTQVHFLAQADYQWRRFSIGLRYTRDLQPYIKYTKPDGTIDEEKNQSLQFLLRFRIWQPLKL